MSLNTLWACIIWHLCMFWNPWWSFCQTFQLSLGFVLCSTACTTLFDAARHCATPVGLELVSEAPSFLLLSPKTVRLSSFFVGIAVAGTQSLVRAKRGLYHWATNIPSTKFSSSIFFLAVFFNLFFQMTVGFTYALVVFLEGNSSWRLA